MFTKADFLSWKQDKITRALFEYVQDVQKEAKERLAVDAGINPPQDRYDAGGIEALKDVLEWQPQFSEGDQDGED